MRTRSFIAGRFAVLLVVLAAAAVGCSKPTTPRNSNHLPTTRLFLQGDLDTLNYHFRTHWSGDDPDGDVVGFELQLAPGHDAPDNAAWHFTTAVDSILAPPIGDGVGAYTLYVRAIDAEGGKDPNPASLFLVLRNHRPTVQLYLTPRRLKGAPYHFPPVATFHWKGTDPEGDNTVTRFHVWLDGSTFDSLISVKDSVFTLRQENFGDVSTTRTRTLFVAALDEANAISDTAQFSWTVDAYTVNPARRVLLVDNYNVDPRFTDNNTEMDQFYRSEAAAVSGGTYQTLDLFDVEGFRNSTDAAELFRHYDLIIWYNESGDRILPPSDLGNALSGLAQFLDRGGRLFLSHLSVVGQDTLLNKAFDRKYLGVQETFCQYPTSQPRDCNYTILPDMILHSGNEAHPSDTLASSGFASYSDLFIPSDSTTTEFYIRYADAQDDTTLEGYKKLNHAGVVTKYLRSGGRATFSGIPLYQMSQFGNRDAVVLRLLTDLVAAPRTRFARSWERAAPAHLRSPH